MAQVTLKDVSEAAGVSVQTVSQILNPRYEALYHPQTRQKVMQAAKALGYRPSAAARAMLNRRSHIIGVLVPIVRRGWFFQLDVFETMLGMNQRLAQDGYVTSVIPVSDVQSGGGASRAFREQLLDGVVAIGWVPDDVAAFVEEVARVCIWCDTNVDRSTGCIRRDELHAGRLLASRVAELGYRRIVWLTYEAPSAHYSGRDRRAGIEEVARAHGIPFEVFLATRSWIDDAPEALLPLLSPDTAVLAENMHFAQAVANQARALGLAAGEDFGLAACDHSNERAAVLPDLSRVVVDRTAVGEQIALMMLQALESGALPESILVQGKWFEGNTLRKTSD